MLILFCCRRAVGIARLKQPENLGPGSYLHTHTIINLFYARGLGVVAFQMMFSQPYSFSSAF
jgi:hypothetical protein